MKIFIHIAKYSHMDNSILINFRGFERNMDNYIWIKIQVSQDNMYIDKILKLLKNMDNCIWIKLQVP